MSITGKAIDVKFSILERGEFGIVSKNPKFKTELYQVTISYNCRETFATAWGQAIRRGAAWITLTTTRKSRLRICQFIKKLEDKLGLKDRTVFHRITNRVNGVVIKPSKWWLRSAMRRSIFTIFLRAGKKFTGDFDVAINSQRYFQQTKNAVQRFLEGNTYYRGKSGGWVNVFCYAGKAKVKNRLLPENEDKRPRIPVFGKEMEVSFYSYRAQTGNYAPLLLNQRNSKHKIKYWSYCREKMEGRRWTSIVFCYNKTQGKYIAAFIRRIERRLKLPKYSECGPTNRKNIMWIKVSPFWRSTTMRKSFFTALLRASMIYNPNKAGTYTKALTETKYFKPTAVAVKLFLQGYTGWNGKNPSRYGQRYREPKQFSGWVNEFSDRSRSASGGNKYKEEVKKKLKKV